jgi:hypothetical protein
MIECHFAGDSADFSSFTGKINKGQTCSSVPAVVGRPRSEWIAGELQLVSEEHKYGGTLDDAVIGKLTLADVKVPKYLRRLLPPASWLRNLWNKTMRKIERQLLSRLDEKTAELTCAGWAICESTKFPSSTRPLLCSQNPLIAGSLIHTPLFTQLS